MSFFKAYDMRGTFGADFDLALVERIGRALPTVLARANGAPVRRLLVGRDCRETSSAVRDALVRGLVAAGAEVTDLGLCTTPMVYFFTAEDGYDGSVMVTASHNPPGDNGLKVSRRGALPVGYADGLDELERLVRAAAELPTASVIGSVRDDEAMQARARRRYVDWQRTQSVCAAVPLRYAVDCSNGMASLLVKDLFPGAVVINDTLDGSFPNHSPNPLTAESREQLANLVCARGLDFGIIFDGDADRAMFVDERGAFVQPDYLIPVVARETLQARDRAATAQTPSDLRSPYVLHDVRTSRGAIEVLRETGFEPVMVPVGHAFAKPRMRQLGALCGGELAGHYYFREFFNCDSGVLAALRVVSAFASWRAAIPVTGHRDSFGAMMDPIRTRYANSGELNFRVEDKDAAIGRVLEAAAAFGVERDRSTIDGVRLEFDEGWVNVRKSNTEPYLRLLIECRDELLMGAWRARLEKALA